MKIEDVQNVVTPLRKSLVKLIVKLDDELRVLDSSVQASVVRYKELTQDVAKTKLSIEIIRSILEREFIFRQQLRVKNALMKLL